MSAKGNRMWVAALAVGLALAGNARADAEWFYRAKFTIQHTNVTADLTNFPVLISGMKDIWKDTGNGGHVGQADGGDILFTKADGLTRLNHEIESYTGSNGELVAWVMVDALSSNADTELYMYYGNAAVSNQWNAGGTWDAHCLMVQHLQGTNTTALDSTTNARNGTLTGGATPHIAGEMDGAVNLNGINGTCLSTVDMNAIGRMALLRGLSITAGCILVKDGGLSCVNDERRIWESAWLFWL